MADIHIHHVGFLNEDTVENSLGRLGMAVLPSGVSPLATTALVRLSCQAHGEAVAGLSQLYDERLLGQLTGCGLISWSGGDAVRLV